MELGATDVVNSKETDAVKAIKEITGGGPQVVIEAGEMKKRSIWHWTRLELEERWF